MQRPGSWLHREFRARAPAASQNEDEPEPSSHPAPSQPAPQILAALGVASATQLVSYIQAQLAAGLRAHYVLDSPAAGAFAEWADSATPGAPVILTDFYVYNVTNSWAVAHKGARPRVQEIGPLTYIYRQRKVNISWDAEELGDVVTYSNWQYYVAADARTLALEQAIVCSPYAPLLGALANPAARALLQLDPAYTSPDAMWTNRSTREVLWGWEDPLLTFLAAFVPGMPTRYPGLQSNDSSLEEARARHGPDRMYTGVRTPQLSRELLTWDGMSEMTCCPYGPCGDAGSGANSSDSAAVPPWHSDEAEQVQGSFGDQFHQFIDPSETLRVSTYGFGIYRHWDLTSDGSTYSVGEVALTRFQLAPGTMGNDTVSPVEANDYDNHGPSGLLNLTQCFWGAQIYLSKPR